VDEMQNYGIIASVIRQDILSLAKEREATIENPTDCDKEYHNLIVKKLYRNIQNAEDRSWLKMNSQMFNPSPSQKGYKRLKSHEISNEVKVDIVHAVVVLKHSHQEVADNFGVIVSLVGNLIKKCNLQDRYLRLLLQKDSEKSANRDIVNDAIVKL
jgi:hypothetical protein